MIPEGRLDLVVADDAELGVVVLHPHPDYGGDRYNLVVDALFREVTRAGWAAVRFDFSSSATDVATAEAAEALARLPSDLPVAMAGYSFGAGIATQVLDPRIVGWVLIAPPFTALGFDVAAIGADPRPKLVLSPTHDQFCPPDAAAQVTSAWTATTLEPIDGADHFIGPATRSVAARSVDFIRAPHDGVPS